MKRYSGRDFSPEDLQAIVRTIELNPTVKRTPLSRLVCAQLDWRRPDGRLREMSCRVAMLRMQADGLITLPASQIPKPRRRAQRLRRIRFAAPAKSWAQRHAVVEAKRPIALLTG
jgi:hypothetical protein